MSNIHNSRWGAGISALMLAIVPGTTQAADPAAGQNTSKVAAEQDQAVLEEVIVSGHPLSAEGLAQPFATLDGDSLRRAQAASLGATLESVPSVHTSSFGQAVGRPVIRGLAGSRVKILEDRIDSLDASVSSPDHASTIDPFIAEGIEVFMGPSTLVYGSGALGGVVDVHTGRIPHALPESTSARFEMRGADNGDRRTAAGRIDTGSGNFALHIDGFYRDADDYDIPGFAESRRLRELEQSEEAHSEHEHDDDHEQEHEAGEAQDYVRGTLPGSFLETYGGAVGGSYIGDSAFFGLAVSRYESNYGLPGHSHAHHHHEDEHNDHDEHEGEEHEEHEEHHDDEEGSAELDLEQTRIDLEWGQQLAVTGLESLNLRIGYNDYEHVEFEPNGSSGTTFASEGYEGRFEVVHSEWAGIAGSAGVQLSATDFSALGEEAFVAPVETGSTGLFYVGQRSWGELELEGGLRGEWVEHQPESGSKRDFSLFSASLGFIQPVAESWQLNGQLDFSSRAPTAVELFSNGAHLATQSYEIGDPDLDEEEATNLSLGMKYQQGRWLLAINAYYTEFKGFIYEAATGEERDELPVLQWQQEDARLYGADAQAQWEAMRWDSGSLSLQANADAVRSKLDEGENRNLPRIPPLRWSLGASLNWQGLAAELAYTRVEEQDDTAPLELATDAYNDLHLHLVYAMEIQRSRVELFVNGSNLTDDEQRLHTSYIKDLAPQPGRTLEAGFRVML